MFSPGWYKENLWETSISCLDSSMFVICSRGIFTPASVGVSPCILFWAYSDISSWLILYKPVRASLTVTSGSTFGSGYSRGLTSFLYAKKTTRFLCWGTPKLAEFSTWTSSRI